MKTREEWLVAGAAHLADVFERAGYPLPPVKVSCAWPGGGGRGYRRIGECWPRSGGINVVYINPRIASPVAALAILAHELAHAIDNCEHGHRGPFVKICRATGLDGKPTQTHAGPALARRLSAIATAIGAYPA